MPENKIENVIVLKVNLTSIIMATVFEVCALNNKLSDKAEENLALLSVDRPAKEKVYTTGGGSTTYRKFNCKNGDKKSPLCLYYKDDPANGKQPITVTKGIEDPNSEAAKKKNKAKDNDKADLTFETRLSKAGIFGDVISKIHPAFMHIIALKNEEKNPDERIRITLVEEKPDPKNPGQMKITEKELRSVKGLLTTHYGETDQVPVEFRGKPIPDPKIRVKLDFARYPASFGKLAGTPKSIVRDYNQPDGKSFRIARVDGKLIDKDNAYKVVTSGSLIHEIRIDYASVAITDKFVSVHAHVCEMVIETRDNSELTIVGEDGQIIGQIEAEFNPEDRYDQDETTAPPSSPVTTQLATVAPVTTSDNADTISALGAEVDKVMSGLM